MHPSVIYPFEARIAKRTRRMVNGCLEWTGSTCGGTEYGKMTINKKDHRVHRAVWEHHHGPIPDGLNVLHKCDNPPCCEIGHLFLGTFLDNSRDMHSKGRGVIRERVGTSKLTSAQVIEARILLKTHTQREIAKRLGIGTSQMNRIAHRQSWQSVP